MELEQFRAAFVEAKRRNKKSDVEIAALLGVSQQTVSRWDKGQGKPPKPTVLALRAVLPGFAELLDEQVAA